MKSVPFFYAEIKGGGATDDVKNYELAKIDYSNGLSIKEIADKYNVSVATVRKWKSRYNWDSVTKKRDKSVTRKKTKEVAKILVEEGATIKEASEETGVNESTLYNYSAKENWIQSQKEFSQRIYSELQSEHLKEHIQRKKKALEYLDFITEKSVEKLKEDEITVDKAVSTIIASIKGQSEILGIQDIKSIIEVEELEIKKNKDKKPDTLDKVGNFLKKLDRFL